MSFSNLNEWCSTTLKSFKKSLAFMNSIKSQVRLNAVSLISTLSFIPFSGSFCHRGFSRSNQSFISSDEPFKSCSFWVESVLEMSRGDTESDLGISKSGIDLFINFMMFSGSPSVFFLLRPEFEVEISDKVLEGSNQFSHWAFSLNL